MPHPRERSSKLRFLQFNLRTLLILVSVAALCLGLCAQRVARYRKAREAIRLVDGKCDVTVEISPFHRPFVWLFGEDLVSQIRGVDLCGHPKVDDQWMQHLEQMPHLRELDLGGTDVTSSGLYYLRRLKHLENLSLRSTAITCLTKNGRGIVNRGILPSARLSSRELSSSDTYSKNRRRPKTLALPRKPDRRHLSSIPLPPHSRAFSIPL